MVSRRVRVRVWVIRAITGLAIVPALFVLGRWFTGNLGTVIPGEVYRSSQLSSSGLTRVLTDRQIRTVLNLRGPNPEQPWYVDERAATLAAGATQVDVAMASDLWLTRDQARMLLDLLDRCERPMLIHCQWGAERTGLVAAWVELLRPGGSLEAARRQFAPYYLYLPIKDGLVMRAHIEQYAGWLREGGFTHTPDRFRQWVRTEYDPGSPSREEWPYDPYPLAVVTRPGGPGNREVRRSATVRSRDAVTAAEADQRSR